MRRLWTWLKGLSFEKKIGALLWGTAMLACLVTLLRLGGERTHADQRTQEAVQKVIGDISDSVRTIVRQEMARLAALTTLGLCALKGVC